MMNDCYDMKNKCFYTIPDEQLVKFFSLAASIAAIEEKKIKKSEFVIRIKGNFSLQPYYIKSPWLLHSIETSFTFKDDYLKGNIPKLVKFKKEKEWADPRTFYSRYRDLPALDITLEIYLPSYEINLITSTFNFNTTCITNALLEKIGKKYPLEKNKILRSKTPKTHTLSRKRGRRKDMIYNSETMWIYEKERHYKKLYLPHWDVIKTELESDIEKLIRRTLMIISIPKPKTNQE